MSAGSGFESGGGGGGDDDGPTGLSERERRRKEAARPDDEPTGLSERERRRKEAARPDDEPTGLSERERRRKEAARPDEVPDEPSLEEPTMDEPGRAGGGRLTVGQQGRRVAPDQAAALGEEVRMFKDARREPRSSEERRAARNLAEQSDFIDREDVIFVERDGQVVATVDLETQRRLGAVGFGAGEEFIIEGGRIGEAGGGEDVGFQGGDPEAILARRAESAVEQAIARGRVAAAGIQDPELRAAAIQRATERISLERGEDFELSISRQDGKLQADVSVTEQRQRAEAAGALEKRLFHQEGVSLQAGEDFEVVATEEGGFEAELTESGEQELATQRTTEAVERLTTGRGLPVTIPGARFLPGVESDTFIFGKGREFPALTSGAAIGADEEVGQVDIPIPGTGRTVEEGLDEVTQAVAGATTIPEAPATGRPATGPGVPSALPEADDFTLTGTARRLAQGAVETPLKLPTLAPLATVGLVKDIQIDFQSEVLGAGAEAAVTGETERLERIPGAVKQTTANVAVESTESFLRDPARTTGALVASLPVSVGLFKAARAAGPRASLAARGLLQPGEEIAGIGGFAVTRRIAGEGAAERLFPGKEPLIFSEEAAIRAARRVRERGAELTGRLTVETGAFGAGPPRLRVKSELETELDEALERMEEARRQEALRRDPVGDRRPGSRAREAQMRGPPIDVEMEEVTGPELEVQAEIAGLDARVEVETADLLAEAMRPESQLGDLGEPSIESELQGETEITAEGETELLREIIVETEVGGRPEAEAEAEAEQELELELEAETELETEAEAELFQPKRRRQRRRRDVLLSDDFEKTFVSPVATPEEVLSGLSEDVLDDS